MIQTIQWVNNTIRILDQTALPEHERYIDIVTVDELIDAIKKLKIRGAPALGIAGAYGLCLGMLGEKNSEDFLGEIEAITGRIRRSRPTAVNLTWGLERIKHIVSIHAHLNREDIVQKAVDEARKIHEEDLACSTSIGIGGSGLISDGMSILTHCNTGGLATGGLGTALGIVFEAHRQKKKIHVYVDETRPLLQGARLTTWELKKIGIDHTLIVDNMAGYLMAQKKVDCVLVGADRIAANGDTANKIGTYSLAVLCEKHRIPFYVAAPSSTIDSRIASGAEIPIEERDSEEITCGFGKRTAPLGVKTYNPAFDVTPFDLITAVVTEKKIFYGPRYDFAN